VGMTSYKVSVKTTLMMTVAAAAFWAAMHEPVTLDICSVGGWGLQTLAVALLACAVLVLLMPAIWLCGRLLQHALARKSNKGSSS